MPITIKPLPPLASFCLGGLLAFSFILIFSYSKLRSEIRQKEQAYLEAITKLASSKAIEPIFSSDLIKLQVLMQQIEGQTKASRASVYDVEHNLLAQASTPKTTHEKQIAHIEPISLEDTIAGYISVSMGKTPIFAKTELLLLILLPLLLGSLLSWSLIRNQTLMLSLKKITQREKQADEAKPDQILEEHEVHAVKNYIYALISVKNLEVTKQQLSGENFRKTISQFEKILSDVLAIYGGSHFELEGSNYKLCISYDPNDDESKIDDVMFKAVCSAFLVLELGGIVNNIPLDLSALISDKDTHVFNHRSLVGLHIEDHLSLREHLTHRIKLIEVSESATQKIVSGFEEPFHTLLENQRNQLIQLLQLS